jgi:hypothetical protein
MRILLTSIGSAGDLHPYISIAIALRSRGPHPSSPARSPTLSARSWKIQACAPAPANWEPTSPTKTALGVPSTRWNSCAEQGPLLAATPVSPKSGRFPRTQPKGWSAENARPASRRRAAAE